MTAPVFTSNATGSKNRIEQLDAYFRDNVVRCGHLESCRLSAERQGYCFNAVQLPHVGVTYELSHNGRPWRIAVCGQEAGRAQVPGSIASRSAWGPRAVPFVQRNLHMQGTTNALWLLFGLPLSVDPWDDNIIVDGEYRHIFDAFALINALSCSSTAGRTGKNGKATGDMKRNCVAHLRATVQILRPTVLVVQGNIAQGMLREAFPDIQVRPKGAWIPGLNTLAPMLSHTSARPDRRRGDREHLAWGKLDSPYLHEVVAPLLSGLSRYLMREAGR
jgi:hypothetical protein